MFHRTDARYVFSRKQQGSCFSRKSGFDFHKKVARLEFAGWIFLTDASAGAIKTLKRVDYLLHNSFKIIEGCHLRQPFFFSHRPRWVNYPVQATITDKPSPVGRTPPFRGTTLPERKKPM